VTAEVKQGYFRRRGWKDLIFLAVVCAMLRWMYRPALRSDVERWKVRPHLTTHAGVFSQRVVGHDGTIPCFFIIPKAAADQPATTGTIGDCLELVPDGRKLNLFEVNLWTGDLVPVMTDDYVPGTMPLAFTRVVDPIDDWAKRFHLFLRHVYDPYMTGSRRPYTYLDWLLPDGTNVHYRRVSPGAGYADAIYESPGLFSVFGWSRINWNGFGWDVALQDGTTYLSPEAYYAKRPQQGSLVGILDEKGNEVQLSRKSDGDLTEIKAPGGRSIKLAYDDRGRVTEIKDSANNFVQYQYDAEDRLVSVSYVDGRRVEYVYNGLNRVVEAKDPSGISDLKVNYDSDERVSGVTLPDGRSYSLRYGPMVNGMNSWAKISGPQSQTVTIALSGSGYSIARVDPRPFAGSVVGHTYTNKFFDFSLDFPNDWLVLAADQFTKQDKRGTAYVLLAVASRDKRMQGTRWIIVGAARPLTSSLDKTSAQTLTENEAYGFNLIRNMGLAKELRTVSKPGEVFWGGRRMARFHFGAEFDVHGGKYDAGVSQLALVDHGYLLMFIASDPAGLESDPTSAVNTLSSLQFLAQRH
jgi:YD repeat-containing protein